MSLHKPPNTSEKVHPLNAHWTLSHVNYLVDSAVEDSNTFFLDFKDAKCTICGDIQPVLKPGKTWRNFETPDHAFNQSRVNAVTVMSHLFMDIRKQPELGGTREKRSAHACLPCFRHIFAIEIIRDNKTN